MSVLDRGDMGGYGYGIRFLLADSFVYATKESANKNLT